MIPKDLQGVLWSCSVDKLDLNKDKEYIIHQILAYGSWENIIWLFDKYGKDKVKEVFINYPSKDYSPAGLKFVSKILLDVENKIDPQRYDRSTPRIIG